MKRTILWAFAAYWACCVSLWMGASEALASSHDQEFYGVIESLPAGLYGPWTVSGRLVHVTHSTRLKQKHGPFSVGTVVEVEGWPQSDGSFLAREIESKGYAPGTVGNAVKFYGTIQSLPPGLIGQWVVSGQQVEVTPTTWLKAEHGPFVLGALVEVEGIRRADLSILASKIETKSQGGVSGGGEIKFYGTVEFIPPGTLGAWQVGGRTVWVDAQTRFEESHGPILVGTLVEVKALLNPDGSYRAREIESKPQFGGFTPSPGSGGSPVAAPLPSGSSIKIKGLVESMPARGLFGMWRIAGREVEVTLQTRIREKHGALRVGGRAEVKGIVAADGRVLATSLESKR